jgi:hypothetical protein
MFADRTASRLSALFALLLISLWVPSEAAQEDDEFRRTKPFTLNCSGKTSDIYQGRLVQGTEKFAVSVSPKDSAMYVFSFSSTGFEFSERRNHINKLLKIEQVASSIIFSHHTSKTVGTTLQLDLEDGTYTFFTFLGGVKSYRGECERANKFVSIPLLPLNKDVR